MIAGRSLFSLLFIWHLLKAKQLKF